MLLLKPAEAKARFDELLDAAAHGEEVTIVMDDGRQVKLVAEGQPVPQRYPGTGKGIFVMAPDFDEPMEDSLLAVPVRRKRTPGSAKGKIWIADDFDDLLGIDG